MAQNNADIIIVGAGIAGLWLLNHLKSLGYDVLLLDKDSIGGAQTIASQGILHSGLKYTLAGKVNELARSISAMPKRWREALQGEGPVNLSAAQVATESQQLLIPKGFIGGITKTLTTHSFGESVNEIPQEDWPQEIKVAGFQGSLINMHEMVLDIPSVIKALAEPYLSSIRRSSGDVISKLTIYTSAEGNLEIAQAQNHNQGLETQHRPLLMGLMKNAPFPLYAHLVGTSEKPVATITTHRTQDGDLVWYIGGEVAERPKEDAPQKLYQDISKDLGKYLPGLDLSGMEWAALPIDRVEGKSKTDGWLPDTPTIHDAGEDLYAWPTKLTFAPLLADKIVEILRDKKIEPSGTQTDWSFLPELDYRLPPWDNTLWTQEN